MVCWTQECVSCLSALVLTPTCCASAAGAPHMLHWHQCSGHHAAPMCLCVLALPVVVSSLPFAARDARMGGFWILLYGQPKCGVPALPTDKQQKNVLALFSCDKRHCGTKAPAQVCPKLGGGCKYPAVLACSPRQQSGFLCRVESQHCWSAP